MNAELFLIISLCLIIISMSLFQMFQKNKLIKSSLNDLEKMNECLIKNYEIHLKYLEDLVKKMHTLNLKVNLISRENNEETDIKFTTSTVKKFEDQYIKGE